MIQTATHDWTFDTTAELWEFGGSGGFEPGDGDPLPGCLTASRGFGASFDYGSTGGGSNLQNLWDFFGIPHSAIIIKYRLAAHWRFEAPPSGAINQQFRLATVQVTEGTVDLIDTTVSTAVPSAWFSGSGESDYSCGNYSPTAYIGLRAITQSTSGRLDTVHMEVDYIDDFVGCCTFACAGGSGGFTVTPDDDTAPIVYGVDAGWVTGLSGPSSGPGNVTFTVSSNSGGVGRLATIMVNDVAFYIIQKSNC